MVIIVLCLQGLLPSGKCLEIKIIYCQSRSNSFKMCYTWELCIHFWATKIPLHFPNCCQNQIRFLKKCLNVSVEKVKVGEMSRSFSQSARCPSMKLKPQLFGHRQGINFINILRAPFFFGSVICSFSVLIQFGFVLLENENWQSSYSKMLVNVFPLADSSNEKNVQKLMRRNHCCWN